MISSGYVCLYLCVYVCMWARSLSLSLSLLRLCHFHIPPEYRTNRSHDYNTLNYFPTIHIDNVVGAVMCDVLATPVSPTLRS